MLTSNKSELRIFNRFEIDYNLPKFQKKTTTLSTPDDEGDNMMVPIQDATISNIAIGPGGRLFLQEGELDSDGSFENTIKNPIWKKIFKKKPKKEKAVTYEEIQHFFTKINYNSLELKNIKELATYYEKEIKKAISFGQTAYKEILAQHKEIIRLEAYLIELGLTKYVTEKQIIDFYLKVKEEKNIKLTWVKNYIRPIPNAILELKQKLDNNNLFDNYVILHYDPKNNGSEMTKQEKEVAKDPIIFGVTKESRKLYFVADWKDEYCDLTLEQMFETLGEKVSEINNETVRSFIKELNPSAHTLESYID